MLRVLIFASLCVSAVGAYGGDAVLATGAAQTTICGVLRDETRWGPPGFGEHPKTDSKFTVWIVSLRKPVVVDFGKDIGQSAQRTKLGEIELSIDPSNQVLNLYLEQLDHNIVVAFGRLWTGTSQGDVTPVVLELLDLRRIKAGSHGTACRVAQG